MEKRPDDPLGPFIETMHLFCVSVHLLNEWAEKNKDEIRAKLTDGQQAELRKEFRKWRDRLTRSS